MALLFLSTLLISASAIPKVVLKFVISNPGNEISSDVLTRLSIQPSQP